jgi:hypothetical protein
MFNLNAPMIIFNNHKCCLFQMLYIDFYFLIIKVENLNLTKKFKFGYQDWFFII